MSSNKSGTIFCTINTFWVNLRIKVGQRDVMVKFWSKFIFVAFSWFYNREVLPDPKNGLCFFGHMKDSEEGW